MRKRMNRRKDKKFFRRTSGKTKSVNIGRVNYRGGIRF